MLALTGDQKVAAQIMRTLREFDTQRYVSPVEFACLHVNLGQAHHTTLARARREC